MYMWFCVGLHSGVRMGWVCLCEGVGDGAGKNINSSSSSSLNTKTLVRKQHCLKRNFTINNVNDNLT